MAKEEISNIGSSGQVEDLSEKERVHFINHLLVESVFDLKSLESKTKPTFNEVSNILNRITSLVKLRQPRPEISSIVETGAGLLEGGAKNEVVGHRSDDLMGKVKSKDEYLFFSGISEILLAIKNKELLEGIDIASRVKEKNFRFTNFEEPDLCSLLSEVLSESHNQEIEITYDVLKLGEEKRIQNADDHAKKTFNAINDLKIATEQLPLRKVAEILNENKVFTSRGGPWHPSGVKNLYERWEKLGLKKDQ